MHDFSVAIHRCCKDIHVDRLFPPTDSLWDFLPVECFPLTYNLNVLASRVNKHPASLVNLYQLSYRPFLFIFIFLLPLCLVMYAVKVVWHFKDHQNDCFEKYYKISRITKCHRNMGVWDTVTCNTCRNLFLEKR